MDLREIKISDLNPAHYNPRQISDEMLDRLRKGIDEFGIVEPIVINKDMTVIGGHQRLKALEALGRDSVPCVVLDLPKNKEKALNVALNKISGEWDYPKLKDLIAEIDDGSLDMELTGFSDDELAEMFGVVGGVEGLTDPDNVPEPPAEPVTKLGDVWLLGNHRLMCGDSTSIDAVEGLMDGLMADGCWTDPPYNVNYESKTAGKIKNDNMGDEPFAQFLRDAFVAAYTVMKPGAAIYVAHADTEGINFRSAFKAAAFKISGCLIWVKNSLVLGRSDYQWQHEPILYGWKPGAAHRWYGGRKQTTITELDGSVFTHNADGSLTVVIGSESIVISGDNLVSQAVHPTVIRCEKPKRSDDHPTMKPVELISRMLRNSTRQGDLVLDLFGGSGSTLISCEMMGRVARMMELDPKFADVIITRWQDFTGKKAILESTGQTFDELKEAQDAPTQSPNKTETP